MNIAVHDIRQFINLQPIVNQLCQPSLREIGIYIDERELLYYQMAPWIRAYALFVDNDFAGWCSINFSEQRWGRCIFNEYYIKPQYRGRLINYRFYKWLLGQCGGCHRLTGWVGINNEIMKAYLLRMGWKLETTIDRFDKDGKAYYQLSLTRVEGRELWNG